MTTQTDKCRKDFEQKYPYAAYRDGEGYQDIRINGHVVKYLWEGWQAAWQASTQIECTMPCVCCGNPADTATADDADMCYPCAVNFQSAEYSNLKERFTELLKRDYPNADIEDALDDLRPLPEKSAWNAATAPPTEGQRQEAYYFSYDTGGKDASALCVRQGDKIVVIVHGELADAIQAALQSPAVPMEVVEAAKELMRFTPPNRWPYGAHQAWNKLKALLGGKEG